MAKQKDREISTEAEGVIALDVIRTETVLSRLPIHNLSTKDKLAIKINRADPDGNVDLLWEVEYGGSPPGHLAYKLDTLVINRRIDEARQGGGDGDGHAIPKRVRLGSFSDICRELGVSKSGAQVKAIEDSLKRNARTFVNAKVAYRGTDGTERWLKAYFNRYVVVLAGERFSDGTVADSVYAVFTDPYWEVLNAAPARPLDYSYLKELAPMAQRWYEIVSYKIFAALRNNWQVAKITYSEYCTFSGQVRYFDYDHVKKQMWKLHKPHLDSGYILRPVSLDEMEDAEGQADWMMSYIPGPKARAEYATFRPKGALTEGDVVRTRRRTSKRTAPSASVHRELDEAAERLLGELVEFGVERTRARTLVDGLDSNALERAERILDYVRSTAARGKWDNPAGLVVTLLKLDREEAVDVPASGRQGTARERSARAAAQSETEAVVEQEATRMLEVIALVERRVDEALQAATDEQRASLVDAAKERTAREHPTFRSWTPAVYDRHVTNVVRALVRADLEEQGVVPKLF